MTSFTGGPAAGQVLDLRRAPKFLRVVRKERSGEWDALDQLEDRPHWDEAIYAYRLAEYRGTVHVCRRPGRGGRLVMATYAHVEPQPPDEVLRYESRWREWALSMAEKEAEADAKP